MCRSSSFAIAYIEMPDENTVITANEIALNRASSRRSAASDTRAPSAPRAVIERHHEDAPGTPSPGSRRPNRNDWSTMPYFAPGRGHADDFLRAEVRRNKRQARHPRGNRPARQEEIACWSSSWRLSATSDAEHEREVNNQDRAINQFQPNRLHPMSILSAKSPIVSLNLGGLVLAVS